MKLYFSSLRRRRPDQFDVSIQLSPDGLSVSADALAVRSDSAALFLAGLLTNTIRNSFNSGRAFAMHHQQWIASLVHFIATCAPSMFSKNVDSHRIRILEAQCKRHPVGFARLTGLFAVLAIVSFAVIHLVAVVAFLLALGRLIAGIDFNFVIGIQLLVGGYLAVTGFRALQSSRAPVPEQPLTKKNARELLKLLREICTKVRAPLPKSVVLGEDLAVRVVRHARFGVLGWHRHTLVLGLPLMMALDVKQLVSLLAHELGKLGRAHSRLDVWVQDIRCTWASLVPKAQPQPSSPFAGNIWKQGVVGLFFRHGFPYFNRRALVLARHHALSADQLACRVAGSQATMDVLVHIAVMNSYLQQCFWPEILSGVRQSATPNILPYRTMESSLRTAMSHPKLSKWLAMALQQDTDPQDSYPCLRDRLAHAERSARLTAPTNHSAAVRLLRESLDMMVKQMDIRWEQRTFELWAQRHREYLVLQRLERELQAEGERGALHADDHLLWAHVSRQVQGDAAYEALLRLMLIDHPDDANARFELGALLLEKTDVTSMAQGAEMLRVLAVEQTHQKSLAAAQRYGQWLQLLGKSDRIHSWADEVRRLEHLAQEAASTLRNFDRPQSFTGPNFSARELRRLREAIVSLGVVEKVHLVSKVVEEFPDWRFGVLLVDCPGPWRQTTAALSSVLDALELPLSIVVVNAADPAWATVARRAVVAQIRNTVGAHVLDLSAPALSNEFSTSSYMPA